MQRTLPEENRQGSFLRYRKVLSCKLALHFFLLAERFEKKSDIHTYRKK